MRKFPFLIEGNQLSIENEVALERSKSLHYARGAPIDSRAAAAPRCNPGNPGPRPWPRRHPRSWISGGMVRVF